MVITQLDAEPPPPARVPLARQLALCGAMTGTAWLIIALDGRSVAAVFSGWTIASQLIAGGGVGLLALINAWAAWRVAVVRPGSKTSSMVDSYGRFDLDGWNPLWLALCAGVGEEFLFRGAIQPVAGLVPAAILFASAHARAYRFNAMNRRVVLQFAGLLLAGVLFGLLARTVGLTAAIVVHVAIDVGGLMTVRALQRRWLAGGVLGNE